MQKDHYLVLSSYRWHIKVIAWVNSALFSLLMQQVSAYTWFQSSFTANWQDIPISSNFSCWMLLLGFSCPESWPRHLLVCVRRQVYFFTFPSRNFSALRACALINRMANGRSWVVTCHDVRPAPDIIPPLKCVQSLPRLLLDIIRVWPGIITLAYCFAIWISRIGRK